jgi:hypothetical protein
MVLSRCSIFFPYMQAATGNEDDTYAAEYGNNGMLVVRHAERRAALLERKLF